MIGDVTKRALITISLDAKDAQDGFEKLDRTVASSKEKIGDFQRQSDTAMQKLTRSVGEFGGKIEAAFKGIDKFSKALAPYNQALELAGKAMRFFNEGMDEFAKTSPENSKRVQQIRDDFNSLTGAVKAAAGAIAVEFLESYESTMARIADVGRKDFEEFFFRFSGRTQGVLAQHRRDLAGGIAGGLGSIGSLSAAFNERWGGPWGYGEALGNKAEQMKRDYANRRGPSTMAGAGYGITGTDRAGGVLGFGNTSYSLGESATNPMSMNWMTSDAMGGVNARLDQQLADQTKSWHDRVGQQRDKRESFLESAFGPIDEFNAYATAFQTLTGAVSAGLNAWIDGSMSAGAAIKKFLADAIKGLASQMAVESLKHGAYALGSLAFGDVRGAGQHAAAAAAFGAGAVAAAVAAKEMGGSASPPRGAGGGATTGPSGGGGGGSGGGGQQQIIVVYGDPFASSNPRERQLYSKDIMRAALGGAGVEDK